MTSTIGLYPLETLRTRLAMGDYDSLFHAVKVITAEEGFMAFSQVCRLISSPAPPPLPPPWAPFSPPSPQDCFAQLLLLVTALPPIRLVG